MSQRAINDQSVIHDVLHTKGRIAIVGLSPKEHRDSHRVGRYLHDHGYDIVPVHPGGKDVFGKKTYTSLKDIEGDVEVVNIFMNPDNILPIIEEAIDINARYLWMQLGVINETAAARAREAGLEVVMDRCLKIEHGRAMSGPEPPPQPARGQ